jgi:Zn-dependent peptidase ImmA (M78 family)
MDPAVAAKRLKIESGRLENIESGLEKITFPMLRRVANLYKRPVAAFYLQDIPKSPEPVPDFRRLPQSERHPLSPEALQQIRAVSEKQKTAVALSAGGEFDWHFVGLLNDSLKKNGNAGYEIRSFLGVESQKWTNEYEAFNYWRRAVESNGILTFQITKVSVNEMSGFSLAYPQYPAIALNRKDPVRRRIFTLLHELCHILLGLSGLCDVSEMKNYQNTPQSKAIEEFCNHSAASALVPEDSLSDFDVFINHNDPDHWEELELTELANAFMVSHEMIILRLIETGKATNKFLTEWRESHPYRHVTRKKGDGPRETSPQKVIRTQGTNYVSLVLNALQSDQITASRACEYLDLKAKHLAVLERTV